MQTKFFRLFLYIFWCFSLIIGIFIYLTYSRFPTDGATGDVESFSDLGFRIQWLLEERSGGLEVDDIIVRAGGYTADEWMSGAPRGTEWNSGRIVRYEIFRDGSPLNLDIRMTAVSFRAIFNRWFSQFLIGFGLALIGGYVFWRRHDDTAARLLMIFCVSVAVQTWIDAYNFQFPVLPRPNLFWFHFFLEYASFVLIYASILNFTLVFPSPHPLLKRYPVITYFAIYLLHPILVAFAMVLSPTWWQAMLNGSHISWIVALTQALLAVVAGTRSYFIEHDLVKRVQLRWILYGTSIGLAIGIPGYIIPLALSKQPPIQHPIVMLLTVIILLTFAVPILRYRLFDIEIVINRTLAYATLTVLLAGMYFALVRFLTLVIQLVWSRPDQTLVVFLSTLSIALTFNPLHQRVQLVIDRAFYRQKLNYRKLLPEMTERLATSILPDQLAALLTDELPRRLQIKKASLLILDRDTEKFENIRSSGQTGFSLELPLAFEIRNLNEPLMRLKPSIDLSTQSRSWLEEHQIELVIPLEVGGNIVGLYTLGPKESGQAYNGEEVRLLNILGQQAAVGVENSRLLLAEQEQRRLAEALKQAAEVVSSTLDLEQVLDHILEQVSRVVSGDTFNVMLLEDGYVKVVRYRGYEKFGATEQIKDLSLSVTEYSTISRMLEDGQSLLIADTSKYADWVARDGWEWLQSYVSAPIQIGGQIVGLLNVDGSRPSQFQLADAQRLKAFADHAAIALQNARLFAERTSLLAKTQEQTRQIQQIIDTVPEGVLLLDENRRILLTNPAAVYFLDKLTDMTDLDQPLLRLADYPVESLMTVSSTSNWIEITTKEHRHIVEVVAHPLEAETQPAGWVLVLRDVTREREVQAQVQMQERLATVGQLAAGIAHDFNNILAAILIYVELVALDDNISYSSRHQLTIVQDQIQRATGLIRQILDFGRNSTLEPCLLDLTLFMKELESLLEHVLPNNIHLDIDFRDGQYLIEADPTCLQQVFMNLSLNARDAMTDGGKLLFKFERFSLQQDERPPYPDLLPGDWIGISIHDTGIGIPSNILPHVFDPFYTTKPVGKGTGLGLAQAYGIIKQHGGSIDVQSPEREGTTVRIFLPALKEEKKIATEENTLPEPNKL